MNKMCVFGDIAGQIFIHNEYEETNLIATLRTSFPKDVLMNVKHSPNTKTYM